MDISIQTLVDCIPQERKADALRLWGISLLEDMLAELNHSQITNVLPYIENAIFSLKHSDEQGLKSAADAAAFAAHTAYAARAAYAAAHAAYAAYAATHAAYAAYAAHTFANAADAAAHATYAAHTAYAAKKEIQGNISFLVLAG